MQALLTNKLNATNRYTENCTIIEITTKLEDITKAVVV